MDKLHIIALGGSIMMPDKIDIIFLSKFKQFIKKFVDQGHRFIIVAGGGKICRDYQFAAHEIAQVVDEDKDWLGIHATRMNAHLLRTIFRDQADPVVIDRRHKILKLTYPITIASGWSPGWSTDYIAIALAIDFSANRAVIAGKPSHVFDQDPSKFKNAQPFDQISWSKYRQLIPEKWSPGFSSPVDPIAAKLAESKKVIAYIIHGNDFNNFQKVLENKKFIGTIIS